MSRIARAVLEGVPHHITQRGNGRQVVFDTDEGRRLYLDLLRHYAERFQLSLWAYCLMNNHVHLIAVPQRSDSMSRALGRTHAQYATYLNLSRRSSGHLWQARYYSCPLGGSHLWRAMLYVEQNPVRAHLIGQAADYPWSSATAHLQNNGMGGFLDLSAWRERFDSTTWRNSLAKGDEDEAFRHQMHQATLRGRPLCDSETLRGFEQRLGRTLRPRPTGRPRATGLERSALANSAGE